MPVDISQLLIPAVEASVRMGAKYRPLKFLRSLRRPVLFEGISGVGKSALIDQLHGRARAHGFRPRKQSQRVERQTLGRKTPFRANVIPGQELDREREKLLRRWRSGRFVPHGVVYVVADGYRTIHELVEELQIEDGIRTLSQFRRHSRAKEVERLRELGQLMRDTIALGYGPSWFMVVISKVDLIGRQNLRRAARRYFVNESSAFRKEIELLQEDLRTSGVSVVAASACARLEDFRWGDELVQPQLSEDDRDALLDRLLGQIDDLCGAAR